MTVIVTASHRTSQKPCTLLILDASFLAGQKRHFEGVKRKDQGYTSSIVFFSRKHMLGQIKASEIGPNFNSKSNPRRSLTSELAH